MNHLLNYLKIRIIFLYIYSYLPFWVLFIPLCRFKSVSGIIFLFPKVFFNIPSRDDLLVENFLEYMFIWNLILPLEGIYVVAQGFSQQRAVVWDENRCWGTLVDLQAFSDGRV